LVIHPAKGENGGKSDRTLHVLEPLVLRLADFFDAAGWSFWYMARRVFRGARCRPFNVLNEAAIAVDAFQDFVVAIALVMGSMRMARLVSMRIFNSFVSAS
jgi:hypothetical protein